MYLAQKIQASPKEIYDYLKVHSKELRIKLYPGIGIDFIESKNAITTFTMKIPKEEY